MRGVSVTRAALGVVVGVAAVSSGVASAACPTPATRAQLDSEMNLVEKELNEADFDLASRMLAQVTEHFACTSGPADVGQLARFALQRAELAFFEQDEEVANRWAIAARTLAPEPKYPASIPVDHPFRAVVKAATEPPVGRAAGKAFAIGKKGYVFVNGVPVARPEAKAEVPALVQVFDRSGRVQFAAWQDGAAFPDAILVIGDGAIDTNPPFLAKPANEPSVITKAPTAPKAPGSGPKIPLIAVGGTLAVGAGVLYALGGVAAGNLGAATNQDELAATRTQANAMVLGAGLAGAAAVGLTVTGFVASDRAWVGLNTRF